MEATNHLKQKLGFLWPHLDERTKRLTAAAEAKSIGRGGISMVHHACGLSRTVIAKGIREIEQGVSSRINFTGSGIMK